MSPPQSWHFLQKTSYTQPSFGLLFLFLFFVCVIVVLSMFIICFIYTLCFFVYQIWSGLGRGYSELCLNIIFSVSDAPAGALFSEKMTHFENIEHDKFSKKYFWAISVCAGMPQTLFSQTYKIPDLLTWQFPQKCVFNQKLYFWSHKLSKYRHFCAYIWTLDPWPFHKKN